MEVFLLYLDDIEDAIFAVALVAERIRRLLTILVFCGAAVLIQALAIQLALREPALGAGVAALLTVVVLYRSATASMHTDEQYA